MAGERSVVGAGGREQISGPIAVPRDYPGPTGTDDFSAARRDSRKYRSFWPKPLP